MFINYFKAAIYISFKSYEEAMKAEKKLGIFFRNQSLSKKNDFATLKDYIDKAMSILSPSEARILKLRFGLEDGRARELEEVGREFGVSKERIRQIETKALKKIRYSSESEKIKEFITSDK